MDSLYEKTVLPSGLSGLRVISEKMPQVRSVAVGVWIAKGSRDEKKEENGLCHFIEHMSFKGTKKRTAPEIAKSLESIGGHLDAFASKEETCFYARALDEHLPSALEVISDLICHSLYNPKDIEREKKVVLEEIKSLEDTPDELVHELFAATLFKDHPLGRPVLGSKESCQNFSRQKLIDFWQRNYTASNAVVAVAGNVEHNYLLELATNFFSFNEGRELPPVDLPPFKPEIKKVPKKISQSHICLGTRTLSYAHPQRYALLLLSTILGGGMSSRLFQKVREREGLAYTIFSYAELYQDTGLFGIYLGVDPKQSKRAIDLVFKEIEQLRQNGLQKDELTHAKAQLKGGLMLGLESTSNRMMRLAKMEINLQKYCPLDETIKEIDAVREEEVLHLADSLLRKELLSLVILGPNKS
ncbi:MAG: pitrilysin family protein [Candidatus Edwardsbacteria bacterium]